MNCSTDDGCVQSLSGNTVISLSLLEDATHGNTAASQLHGTNVTVLPGWSAFCTMETACVNRVSLIQ